MPDLDAMLEDWKRWSAALMARPPVQWCVFCGRKPQASDRGGCVDCDA